MPGMNFVLDKGFQVQSAITQFTFVKMGTADQTCTAVTGATDLGLGVALEAASAADVTKGRIIEVRIMGIARVQASAAITRGTRVVLTATGQVAAVGAGTSNQNVVGVTMYSTSAANDLVDVLLTPFGSLNLGTT